MSFLSFFLNCGLDNFNLIDLSINLNFLVLENNLQIDLIEDNNKAFKIHKKT